jgi:hypothetical protein
MSAYKVNIGCTDLGLASAETLVSWDAVLSYVKDSGSEAYKVNPKSEMTLYCSSLPDAWVGEGSKSSVFQTIADESGNCTLFQVQVQRRCDDVYETEWEGEFSSKDWKLDLDLKAITFKPAQRIGADCIRDGWNDQRNLFALDTVEVKPYFAVYQIVDELVPDVPIADPCTDYWPVQADYCEESTSEIQEQTPGDTKFCHFTWGRYALSGSCDVGTAVPPDDWNTWTLLDNNCPASSLWYTCQEVFNTVVFRFRNGRMFEDVLQYLIDETGCELTVQSDFFNIDPQGDAPDNEAYQAAELALQKLVVFQKSDIKRHSASDQSKAAAWNMKLKDLLADLATMFNVRWVADLDAGTFRIEHVSFFESLEGNDYTGEYYEKSLEQDKSDVVRVQKFRWRDERASEHFTGFPIITDCGEGEKESGVSLFSTDIGFIISNDGIEAIGDDGFVLMSTYDDDGLRLYRNNRDLSFTELHTNYYRHNMAGSGKINDADVTPLSLRKTRKQPAFTVPYCCTDTFSPAQFQTTALGEGGVVAASWNVAQDSLEIELIY